MSVEEIKKSLAELSAEEQNEVTAYLFHLRHRADFARQTHMNAVMADRNPEHWLTPDEFEKRLDG